MSLADIWNYNVQLVPFIFGLFVIELPTLIRKKWNVWYGPVYFAFFDLTNLNADLSKYFADDAWVGNLEEFNDNQEKYLRSRIQILGIKALVAATLIGPSVSAFLASFFLNWHLLYGVLVMSALSKIYRMFLSIIEFKTHAVADRKNINLLVFLYILYLMIYFEVFRSVYSLCRPYTETQNWIGLYDALSAAFIGKFIIMILLVAAASTLFLHFVMNKELRAENIENVKRMAEELKKNGKEVE